MICICGLKPTHQFLFACRKSELNNGVFYSTQKQTQKRLKSGFKIISWTVSTLEGGGSIMLPTPYTLFSLRFWLARNAPVYTFARSFGFCVIWVRISSSSRSVYSGRGLYDVSKIQNGDIKTWYIYIRLARNAECSKVTKMWLFFLRSSGLIN